MGKMRFNFRSEILGKYVDCTVILPTDELRCPVTQTPLRRTSASSLDPAKERYSPGMKFQTVYLCHGGGDDDTLTYRYSNAEEDAQRNKVMLVTPNIANSFGADTCYGVPYMTFLTQELPTVIQSLFPSSPNREDNFIMGYAMGGNVALAAAVLCPQRYAVCMDISGGIGMTMDPETLAGELNGDFFRCNFYLYNATFGVGNTIAGSAFDLNAAARAHKAAGRKMPSFILACGSEEFIRARVERDVLRLRQLDLDVTYLCAEGYDHDFRMWDRYIRLGLDHYLPLKRHVLYPNESGCQTATAW